MKRRWIFAGTPAPVASVQGSRFKDRGPRQKVRGGPRNDIDSAENHQGNSQSHAER